MYTVLYFESLGMCLYLVIIITNNLVVFRIVANLAAFRY